MSFIMKKDKGYYEEEDAIVLSYDLVGGEDWILTQKDFNKPLSQVTKSDILKIAKKRFEDGDLFDKELSFGFNIGIKQINVLDSNGNEHFLMKTKN
jgi:hypothetical protein